MRLTTPSRPLSLLLAGGLITVAGACQDDAPTGPVPASEPGPIPMASVISPVGGSEQIAFMSNRDGDNEIYLMAPDGSGQVNVSNDVADDRNPALSPDGSQIAFGSDRDGDFEIYVMNIDGTGITQLTSNSSGDFLPAWSPDGSQIVFHTDRDGNNEVYSMNADGSGQTNLTNNAGNDLNPEFSPDGLEIVFVSLRDGDAEIYKMNADGSGQADLTNNHVTADLAPAWSPDGSRIAFFSTRGGGSGSATHEIVVMNSDGSGQTLLTSNSASDRKPSWSPDGSQITFSSDRDGDNEVYVMAANGSSPSNLTNDPASDVTPDWGVTPPAVLAVSIDIKPGSEPNCFNNNGHGVLPVAILGSADFDATQVDATTVELEGMAVAVKGKKGNLLAHVEDVNGDGFDDLVVQIEDVDGVFTVGSGTATLTGQLFDGTAVEGSDDICIVP